MSVAAPEIHAESDVSLFVEEINLPQEAEEMGAVANTFRGVENLDGTFNWEGLYFQSVKSQQQRNWKRVKPVQVPPIHYLISSSSSVSSWMRFALLSLCRDPG